MKTKTLRAPLLALALAAVFSARAYSYAWPFMSSVPAEKEVPVIMYHLITKDPRQLGNYGISPSEMEEDLKYLAENGYETVLMKDLIRFVNGRQGLPEKPVVLTFDDGMSSDCEYLLPLLEKYEMKAVLSVVGKFTDENTAMEYSKKPHLTWEQVAGLAKSKRAEIQSHTYALHGRNGSGRLGGEPMGAYQARLRKDLLKLQETLTKKTGRAPSTFTYPLGIMSKGSDEVLKDLNIQASLSCTEGMNVLKRGDPECLYRLKRNIRRCGQPVSSILKRVEAGS